MTICCGKENVLTPPSASACHLPHSQPQHRSSKVSHFLPMPERGCATLQLPGTAPIQLPHCQSSPQQDSNGHALAEMALSYVGMNLVMFWPILDSGLQPAQFRQKISSEWRKKRHLRQLWFTASIPKCLYVLIALKVPWVYFCLEVQAFSSSL